MWLPRNNRSRARATFEVNLYLVPQRPEEVSARVADELVRHLERREIVGPFYDLALGWLAPGRRSGGAFPQALPDRPAFEYAFAYEGVPELVPNAHTGSFGAVCACGADLDEKVHAFLEAQAAGAPARDARIRCACGRATPLDEVSSEVPLAVTGLYVNFCHVDSTEVDPGLLAELGAIVGSPLRVLRERL
ncbi:MAG: hypothetical protein JW751_16250 [Polyangiaceae bacterium]|nr:hypothetical protein [Polyangiaceae bacterium]